jgi:tetratricopeptide (TPR) repeat protein
MATRTTTLRGQTVRALLQPVRGLARLAAFILVRMAQRALSHGHYARAERLFGFALRIAERMLGPNDHIVGAVLSDLGMVHKYQGRLDEAERAYRRAHAVFLAARGEVAVELHGLGKRDEAETLLRRALAVFERTYGAHHYEIAVTMHDLAAVCEAKGDTAEAERLYRRALAIKDKRLGSDHAEIATSLKSLAILCRAQGRDAEANQLYRRALAILERAHGSSHPSTVACRENLDALMSGVQ